MIDEYLEFSDGFDISEKFIINKRYISYMLARSNRMFEYEGLPETLDASMLEFILQGLGKGVIAEHEGNLYAFECSFGGKKDAYYRPIEYIVNNSWLNFNKTLTRDKDCVFMRNDSLINGLLPLYKRYAFMLTESDTSMYFALINSRIPFGITAPDEKTRLSAEKFLNDIIAGKLAVMADNTFLEGINSLQLNNTASNIITQQIELQQYIKASYYNSIGLSSNYNMKRESINSDEAQLDQDALIPLVSDMLKCREEDIEKVNKLFGTNITIKLSELWEHKNEEVISDESDSDKASNTGEDIDESDDGDISEDE